jgi:hypothetical protein
MASPTGTEGLSLCEPQEPRFDSLVTDQVFHRFPRAEMGTQCVKRAIVTNADKPTLDFVPSGGTFDADPVQLSAGSPDYRAARIGSVIEVAGDVLRNLSLVIDVLGSQSKLKTELVYQHVARALWSSDPVPDGPRGMAAFAADNPFGVITRASDPISLTDLTELRARIQPWSPSAPLVYVMHTKLLGALEDTAMAAGTPLSYDRDPVTNARTPYWGPFPILACDFVRLDEITGDSGTTTSVYLVRVGTGPTDPDGIAGVSLLVPKGGRDVRVSSVVPVEGAADVFQTTLYWDVGVDGGSRGAAVARIRGLQSPS